MKEQLQTCIDLVLHGNSFELKLTHNTDFHDTLMDNEEPIVWHEPILDEYWGRFEEEIDARRQVDIVDICDIDMENVEIKKERLAALVAMFVSGRATNSSTHVYFSNANICEEGIISLSKLVEASSMLDIFSLLSHNQIDNMESVRCLSRSLKSHNCASLSFICLTVTLEVLPKYYQSYYSLTLNTSFSATTILIHWGRSPMPSILRVIHP